MTKDEIIGWTIDRFESPRFTNIPGDRGGEARHGDGAHRGQVREGCALRLV